MKVRFKEGNHISYEVLEIEPVELYDETLGKVCDCLKLQTLGYIPVELLESAKDTDVDTLEVLVKLTLEGVI